MKCSYCGAETENIVNGEHVCSKCATIWYILFKQAVRNQKVSDDNDE